jgi:hypothetical protein
MAHRLRVTLTPLESSVSTAGQKLFDGALLDLQQLGRPPSRLPKGDPRPARLSVFGKFFESVRGDGRSETRLLATLDGQLERAPSGDVRFVGSDEPEKATLIAVAPPLVAETDTTVMAEHDVPIREGAGAARERSLRFAFAPQHFPNVGDPTGEASELRISVDRRQFRYLEVRVALEVDGAIEADGDFNDILDVLVTDINPPETCPCDDCDELGPPAFEAGSAPPDDSGAELPIAVALGDRRKVVGLGQILLNDFIAQLRLGQIHYAERDNADDLKQRLDVLPDFIPVSCKFDANTRSAASLFQAWEAQLTDNGQLDAPTWKRLIQTTEQLERFTGRPTPKFAEVGGEVDLLAVDGLGEAAPILLASNDDTIPKPSVRCARTFAKAKDFAGLVEMVRAAEVLLQTCGVVSPNETLGVIRGIYYGTLWSRDFKKEGSVVRNTGFNFYAAHTASSPKDPRACLLCNLFEALADSQDGVEGTRHFDFGHCIIGLEGRFNGTDAAILGAGHSGLEAATWLGDLGGGAAMLADARVGAPKTRARSRFVGTDFGGSINLEGDIAAYVVARDPSVTGSPSPPVFGSSTSPIADALAAYLSSGTSGGAEWDGRSMQFLLMNGGTFTKSTLDNRASVVATMAEKIEAFGCYYLVNRLRQTGRLTSGRLEKASTFLPGAAQEVASIFVDALQQNVRTPKTRLQPATDPSPSPAGSIPLRCRATIQAVKAMETTQKIKDDLRKRLGF